VGGWETFRRAELTPRVLFVVRSQVFAPTQEQADIARLATWKVEDAGRQLEPMRFQCLMPSLIDFRSLPAKGFWPGVIGRIIDRT
jgi:hypothetical protein